jgi:hypothetical protein
MRTLHRLYAWLLRQCSYEAAILNAAHGHSQFVRSNEADAEIERLRTLLFEARAMENAPCFCCGYNGAGYFDPTQHPCAARHHDGYGSEA